MDTRAGRVQKKTSGERDFKGLISEPGVKNDLPMRVGNGRETI